MARDIGDWLEGVQDSQFVQTDVAGPAWTNRNPNDPTYSAAQGLINSGTTMLTEIDLDQNTSQFVASQALHAKRGMVTSHTWGVMQASTVNTAPLPFVNRDNASQLPGNLTCE